MENESEAQQPSPNSANGECSSGSTSILERETNVFQPSERGSGHDGKSTPKPEGNRAITEVKEDKFSCSLCGKERSADSFKLTDSGVPGLAELLCKDEAECIVQHLEESIPNTPKENQENPPSETEPPKP